jgi:hypothetical protein
MMRSAAVVLTLLFAWHCAACLAVLPADLATPEATFLTWRQAQLAGDWEAEFQCYSSERQVRALAECIAALRDEAPGHPEGEAIFRSYGLPLDEFQADLEKESERWEELRRNNQFPENPEKAAIAFMGDLVFSRVQNPAALYRDIRLWFIEKSRELSIAEGEDWKKYYEYIDENVKQREKLCAFRLVDVKIDGDKATATVIDGAARLAWQRESVNREHESEDERVTPEENDSDQKIEFVRINGTWRIDSEISWPE